MQDVRRGRAVVVVTRREWLLTDWSGAGALSHEHWSSDNTWVSWCAMHENNSRQVKSEKWNLRRIGRNAHVCASVFTLRDHSDTWDRAPEPPGALGSVNVQGRS